jgi:hypothetical protein
VWVNFEFLKGMNCYLVARALITSLNEVNDLLMHLVSLNLSPYGHIENNINFTSVFAALTLSEPAKSIKFKVALI